MVDIAFQYGFNSHEQFTRGFKKMFHVTPSRYRKENISVSLIAESSEELKKGLAIPEGNYIAGALMFGYPEYKIHRIPRRLPAKVRWL